MERLRPKLPCWVAACALLLMLAGSSHAGGFPDLGDLDDLDGESHSSSICFHSSAKFQIFTSL
jgi:hypothetical protein